MRIGQELIVKEDFKINTTITDKVITVKEGDKGFLDSEGCLNLTTGKGSGRIVAINGINVKGYDHQNIAKMIFERMDNQLYIKEMIEDNDLTVTEVIDEIEDMLIDILK